MTKTFIFEYFPKIPSEMNSTHPFYPILIPNTSFVKKFILFLGGPQGQGSQNSKKIYDIWILFQVGFVKRFLWLKQKKIVLGVPKFKTNTFIFDYFPKIPSEMN